ELEGPGVVGGYAERAARSAFDLDDARAHQIVEIALIEAMAREECAHVEAPAAGARLGERGREAPLHVAEEVELLERERVVPAVEHGANGLEGHESLVLELAHDANAFDVHFAIAGVVAADLATRGNEPLVDVEVNGLPRQARQPAQVGHL